MELHGENDFKAKSYANASFQIDRNPEKLIEMTAVDLQQQKGVGKSVAEKIYELIETGRIKSLDELVAKTPESILEIMKVKGLGPKKVAEIWKNMGIETVGELLYACNENRLMLAKGFGEKTQESVRKAIEFMFASKAKFHFAFAEAECIPIIEELRKYSEIERIEITGALRRKCNIIDRIEILIGSTNDVSTVMKSLKSCEHISDENNLFEFKTIGGIPVFVSVATLDSFELNWFKSSAAEAHLEKILPFLKNQKTENEIYQSIHMPFIIPELREGKFEFEIKTQQSLNDLIEVNDIKGILHNHSKYSDGANSLKEMAEYVRDQGFEYFGICDHSKTAVYAGGLKEDDIKRQHEEIDQLNERMKPFRIFKGIESDILGDGSLDYSDDVLASFDIVVASVHQNLKMTEEKAMQRLLAAIRNPFTTILGHPTGRLLLMREGYPLDFKTIIDTCAENKVVIELNANPYRLDMDWEWIPYAMEKGVMISINPDAHSTHGIHDIYYGVCSARKGALFRNMTFNAMTLAEMSEFIINRKR